MAQDSIRIPFFGARKFARVLAAELLQARAELERLTAELEPTRTQLDAVQTQLIAASAQLDETKGHLSIAAYQLQSVGALSLLEIEVKKRHLEQEAAEQAQRIDEYWSNATTALDSLKHDLIEARKAIVQTEETAILQEVGIYQYRHPLTDAISYQSGLNVLEDAIKAMTKKDGGAVMATTNWSVNGSMSDGRAMVRDFSKLMLRAFNAEADNLVRGLRPYKLSTALDRLAKVAETIARLGKTMDIRISPPYYALRRKELELTADFLQKQAEEKEQERAQKERLREERKAQQEIEAERMRLLKERQHYENALSALIAKGDEDGASRIRASLEDVDHAIESVDYRAANIRAGYVYVISNIGSFGERMIKVGMTRRLEPMDRIRELSDASVPFNFDVHALFFSNDAVTIETAMHERLGRSRVNIVNRRREFFHATPAEAKSHLAELAGELLQFQDVAEALEYRQGLQDRTPPTKH